MGEVVGEVKASATFNQMINFLIDLAEHDLEFASNLEQLFPGFCRVLSFSRHVNETEPPDLKRIVDNEFGCGPWPALSQEGVSPAWRKHS